MLTSDIEWLAGLLEGEGYFGMKTKSNPQICLDMGDEDVVARMARVVRGKCLGPYKPGPRSVIPRYRTNVSGVKAVGLMMTLHGLMGRRRQSQIERALLTWQQYPHKGGRSAWRK
jgi:hypothetical protein